MISATPSSWAPSGTASVSAPSATPSSSWRSDSTTTEIVQRADDRAGQAALAADDQHRERDEGQREPEVLDRDRADEVRLEHAADRP